MIMFQALLLLLLLLMVVVVVVVMLLLLLDFYLAFGRLQLLCGRCKNR